MKPRLKRLIGADKPKVIAVIGLSRADVEAGVAHARTSAAGLPIRTWCAEDGVTASQVRRELRQLWPALMVVAWTGQKGRSAFKVLAFTVPPFRIVIFNEAHGFSPARSGALLAHARWRLRDWCIATFETAVEWIVALAQWFIALGAWIGRWIAGRAKGIYSLLYRGGQRVRDAVRLAYSLALRGGDRAWSSMLEGMAVIAQFLPQPKLVAQVSDLPTRTIPAAAGATYTRLVLHGRAWPAGKVREAVANRHTDFIVFQSQEDTQDPASLICEAVESNAFAVARQIAYTGWRAQVLNKHPFRRLQPDEAAEVFAPWSSLIVIRRDLFEQLGVPVAATTGAALMLLFWKAAAAGWKSLVVGGNEALTQEPAMPLEDREFALRVPSAPPRRFRARGNVAFSPAHARPFRGLPRILIVSPYLPFPLSHGGAVRIYNLCRALCGQIDFILACFHESGEAIRYPELHEVFREVYAVDIDEKNPDPTVPKQVAEYRNSAMDHLIRTLCGEGAIDLVQLEYTQMAEYRNSTGKVAVLLVEHDITFTLYRQLKDPTAGLWEEFEREALQCSNAVWTMSEEDRAIALEHGAGRRSTVVVPNGVDLARFQPEPRETKVPTILFVGSFRHLPNLLAFEALRQTIMPAVWREFPNCHVNVIAGPNHERAALLAQKSSLLTADPRISIQGFVEDVRPAYRECDVVAIPLPVSAGTNIKVMEAMACGRAIVSTPVGCQGLDLLDGEDLLIREIGPDFAEGLLALLRSPERRESIAAAARHTAERRFSWDAIAADALASILSVVRPPSHAASASEYRESHRSAGSASQSKSVSEVRR
jgi:glycosyltransferase involved in cell wall biosynthesis